MTALTAPSPTSLAPGGNALLQALQHLEGATARVIEASEQAFRCERRLAHARESLEESIAELYGQNAILGRNAEERDACLRRLTAAERYEVREATDAAALARHALEVAQLEQQQARYTVRALEAILLGVAR